MNLSVPPPQLPVSPSLSHSQMTRLYPDCQHALFCKTGTLVLNVRRPEYYNDKKIVRLNHELTLCQGFRLSVMRVVT